MECWWCGREAPTRLWKVMGQRELCDPCVPAVFFEMRRRCAIHGWIFTMRRCA